MKWNNKILFLVVISFISMVFIFSQIVNGQEERTYTGSPACGVCHSKQKKAWDNHTHSKILPSEVNSQLSEGVGCEACHGPGSEHAAIDITELQNLKKKKGDLKIVKNKKSELCGTCHKRTDDGSILTVANDMVVGRQQYTEMLHNKKAKFKMTCVMCHEPHTTSKDQVGISKKCTVCHTGKFKKDVKIAAMASLPCEACHMPYAAKGVSDTMVNGYHKGDTRSHIFGITIDPNYKLDDGTGHATLDTNGFARLTIEMTCYACHKSGHATDMSREELLEMAAKVH